MILLPLSPHSSWQFEGSAKFRVGDGFYRPQSKVVRDLGVLAAAVLKTRTGSLRVLDAMAGCGVRSLRYWQESGADWILTNDGNPDMAEILQSNLAEAIAASVGHVSISDANRLFFTCYSDRDFYDLIDIDSFGLPLPYLSTMFWAAKIGGLLYLTCTDGRTLTGNLPQNSLRAFGVYPRHHPSAHEQGLRLLLGATQQQAASLGMGVEPIFAFFTGQTYRVMVRLTNKPVLNGENYGFLGYCHHCGNYQKIPWRKLGRNICPHDGEFLTLSGAMWLDKLHDRDWIAAMHVLAKERQWSEIVQLLQTFEIEAEMPPHFYPLKEIGHRGRLDLPKRDRLILALQQAGYRASTTHINSQAIKTDADMQTCIAVARSC